MPHDVAVGVERFANNCADEIGIAVNRKVGAWSIKDGGEIAGRIDVDVLWRSVGRTDGVVLEIRRDSALVLNVAALYIHAAINKNLELNIRLNIDRTRYIVGDMDGDVGLLIASGIDRQVAGQSGKQIKRWACRRTRSRRGNRNGVGDRSG